MQFQKHHRLACRGQHLFRVPKLGAAAGQSCSSLQGLMISTCFAAGSSGRTECNAASRGVVILQAATEALLKGNEVVSWCTRHGRAYIPAMQ